MRKFLALQKILFVGSRFRSVIDEIKIYSGPCFKEYLGPRRISNPELVTWQKFMDEALHDHMHAKNAREKRTLLINCPIVFNFILLIEIYVRL